MHLMAAKFLDAEEMAIDVDESNALAGAIQNVADLYDVGVIGQKAAAWIHLASTLGGIYGPRFVAISHRKAEEKKRGRQSGVSPNVGNLRPMGQVV